MHNYYGESLKFCYVYTNNASIMQEMHFLYINGFILESCHICMENLIITST